MQELLNEILKYIEKDSILTLLAMIAIVVVLVILLILVVSSMRIKIYKDRWWNIQIDNQKKSEYIKDLEQELQSFQIKGANQNEEVLYFAKTRETLKKSMDEFILLQKDFSQLNKEFTYMESELHNTQNMKDKVQEDYQRLLIRFDTTVEENMKHRTNNTRLLTKLESESKKGIHE
ncbi:DNA recombination protein RmuC [hydrothermal vent metagenome]|uniref:DNA recombination protein RmuC n=1 Tax=hydrothermal vent metagenome TaxID=652676 RepID=A0A1W1BG91_9ZZZZ